MVIHKSPYPDITIPDVTLAQYVLGNAHERGDAPALIDGPSGRAVSFNQVAQGARRVASSLAQKGFGKGDIIAIWLPNLPEYAIAFLSAPLLGGINTTLNSLYTAAEAHYVLNDTGAQYLVTVPQFMDRAAVAVQNTKVKEIFVLGEAEGATPFQSLLAGDGLLPDVKINPQTDLVVLPYSSGTSERPKGVMITHANLVAQLAQVSATDVFQDNDTFIGVLPFFHIYGMALILLLSLAKGSTVITMPRFELESFLQLMEKYEVSTAPLVPPIVLALAKQPIVEKFNLSKLRTIICGAAPLGAELEVACAQRLNCLVVQAFGMTELSGASHANPRDADKIRQGSIGWVIPALEAKIVDLNTNAALPPGEKGELCLRGPNCMKGYLNNPEATAQTIDPDGWLHSGDIGYADEDGYFYIVDRVKELIKYNAYQVAPAMLEAVLLTNPNIADCAVIPHQDDEQGEIPKAYIVARTPISEEEVMVFVAERVAPFEKIRAVEFIDAIPKSASGKILRRVLVEKDRAAMN